MSYSLPLYPTLVCNPLGDAHLFSVKAGHVLHWGTKSIKTQEGMVDSSPEAVTRTAEIVEKAAVGLRAVRDGIDPINRVKSSLCEEMEI